MAMRKAKEAKIGGKFLSYGETGSGKSLFALTFPDVACIDSEAGIAHYEGKDITLNNGNTYNNLKLVDNTSDLDELEDDLDAFMDGEYDNEIRTLSIDSETKFYGTMQVAAQETEEKRARKKGGNVDDANISQRSWGKIKIINLKLQQLKIDLSTKGIHVISIAQEAEIKNDDNKVIGNKPDMHKSVKFDYDTILRHYSVFNKTTGETQYFAEVLKDRTNVTKKGQIIENPCYDIWKEYYEGKSKLEANETNYNKDIKTSTENMETDGEKAEKLVTEWKDMLVALKKAGNLDAINEVNNFIKSNNWDISKLDLVSSKDLTELVKLTKSFL